MLESTVLVTPEAAAVVALNVTSSPVAAALSLQLLTVDQLLLAPPASQVMASGMEICCQQVEAGGDGGG